MIFDDKLYKIEESIVRYMDNDYKGEFMTNVFLAAMDGGTIGMIVVLVVLMVLMFAMSIIPQRKRQKKAQEMMNSIKTGTKIRTIGGFVGIIKAIDNQQNVFVLDISANLDGSMLVTIDKGAVYNVIATPDGVPVSNETAVAAQKEAPVAADDEVADAESAEKKARKRGRKYREAAEGESVEDTFEEGEVVDNDSSDSESNTTGIDGDNDLKF